MKYFTLGWASGDLDDDAHARVLARYDAFLATLADPTVRRFATTVGLNDAWLDRLTNGPELGRLTLLLLTGDNQVGYWRTTLAYGGARIVEGEAALRTGLANRPTEIWYDEFAEGLAGLEHGFLLTSGAGEFRIAFSTFGYSQTPSGGRRLLTDDDRSGSSPS